MRLQQVLKIRIVINYWPNQVYLHDDDNHWMTIELVTDPKIRIMINHFRPTHSIEKSLSTELQRENDVRIRLLKEYMIIERFLM